MEEYDFLPAYYLSNIFEIGITHHVKQTPSRRTPTSVNEGDGMRRRVRATASVFFFWRRRLTSSGSLGWAEGAP